MRRILLLALLALLSTPALAQDRHAHTDRGGARLLPLPREEGVFHFLIFGDRTGGPAEGIEVLAQAVKDANLLGPDLVMTVGDLVEGYNETPQWLEQMREYKKTMGGLDVPWFPVAGNHDIYWRGGPAPPGQHEADFEKHFGPLWYWFPHKNAAFVALFTDEGDPETGRKGFGHASLSRFSDAQLAWLAKTLEETKPHDHVFLFMHHPRWIDEYYRGTDWDRVHELLVKAGNVTAVFAGHIHRIRYDGVRDGIGYYTLATSGGGIPFQIPGTGYLHHMNLVTVRKERITVATIPVGAVMDPRELTPERLKDIDLARNLPVKLLGDPIAVLTDGSAAGALRYRITNPTARPIVVESSCELPERSWTARPDHAHVRLEPGESKNVVFLLNRPADGFGVLGRFEPPNLSVQADYPAEDRRVSLPASVRPMPVCLEGLDPAWLGTAEPGYLELKDESSLRVASSKVSLPDGPLTLECRFRARGLDGGRGLIAKTERSEFGLFLVDGLPTFYLHLDGEFRILRSGGEAVGPNRWHHVAGVFDGEEMRIYLDGKVVARMEATGKRGRNDMPLLLGAEPDAAGRANRFFGGSLDEVRVSSCARYSGESVEIATRHEPDGDTALLLHLDRRIGPFAPDHSPKAAHAVTSGEVEYEPDDRR